jgi:hypothetical protein
MWFKQIFCGMLAQIIEVYRLSREIFTDLGCPLNRDRTSPATFSTYRPNVHGNFVSVTTTKKRYATRYLKYLREGWIQRDDPISRNVHIILPLNPLFCEPGLKEINVIT